MRRDGFEPEDYADDFFDVWPENWPATVVFLDIANQWRTDMTGPSALDYGVLFRRLDRLKLSDDDDWEQMFQDVRQLERGALAEIRKKTGTPQ